MDSYLEKIASQLGPLGLVLAGLWLLSLIVVPILTWIWGEKGQRRGIEVGVVVQVVTVAYLCSQNMAITVVAGLFALSLIFGWSIEFLGSRTGLPFGKYHYTDVLKPQLARVPLLIPLAWFMMLPPSWATSLVLHQALGLEPSVLSFAVFSALCFTAWDLYLDTQMVKWNFWKWDKKGAYFGIPLSNYAGWLVAGFVVSLLAYLIYPAILQLNALPSDALLAIYVLTCLLEFIGQFFFWRLKGSALVGLLAMGTISALALSYFVVGPM